MTRLQHKVAAVALLVPLFGTLPATAQQFQPATSAVIQSAASNNSQLAGAAGPHNLLYIVGTSQAATSMSIRLYDTNTPPTCSSATNLKLNAIIPGASAPAVGCLTINPQRLTFLKGIGVCITGGNANNDNTNAAAGAVFTLMFTQ